MIKANTFRRYQRRKVRFNYIIRTMCTIIHTKRNIKTYRSVQKMGLKEAYKALWSKKSRYSTDAIKRKIEKEEMKAKLDELKLKNDQRGVKKTKTHYDGLIEQIDGLRDAAQSLGLLQQEEGDWLGQIIKMLPQLQGQAPQAPQVPQIATKAQADPFQGLDSKTIATIPADRVKQAVLDELKKRGK